MGLSGQGKGRKLSSDLNKKLLRDVFEETAKGNGRPFMDALADDVRWTIIGSTPWSGTYEGKSSVVADLLIPLAHQLAGANVVSALRFIAEDDVVVVEGKNHSTTRAGLPYPNQYCWVMTMRDGRVAEITEYTDTQLIVEALGPPSDRGRA